MQIEIDPSHKMHLMPDVLPQSLQEQIRDWPKRSFCLFYADTSKANGQLITYPMNADINIEDEEKRLDEFLFKHLSPYKSSKYWPRLHTTIDPKVNQVYKIMEFPVVIDSCQYLSIKQSVRENEKLIALCYRLATLDNS